MIKQVENIRINYFVEKNAHLDLFQNRVDILKKCCQSIYSSDLQKIS